MNVVQLFPEVITSLLYVSRSKPDLLEAPTEVEKIVDLAERCNVLHGITGAMIFTESHFAQVIEGPQTEIYDLMQNIESDSRHRDIAIVEVTTLPERRFPNWEMAYSGPSFYVDRHVKPLLTINCAFNERKVLSKRMIDLLLEFAKRSSTLR